MADVLLSVDAKKRLYLPKDIQAEYGFDGCPVRVEKRVDSLLIFRHEHVDAVGDLARIGEKASRFKGRHPLQVKREIEREMAGG
ncbi:hypothetical protein HY995_02500 [Candidatus Micrarchaeota archaeon]|nr:hypothetical protein [Candidatus Micrarchaeota archaeon]